VPDLREDVDVDELLEQLRSPVVEERKAAAVALDDVAATPEIDGALLDASHDPDAKVRRAAMHSLSCAHCKPDGCLGPAAVDVLVDALLHDPSVRNRRWAAGVTMYRQVGASPALVDAYRHVLANEAERAARARRRLPRIARRAAWRARPSRLACRLAASARGAARVLASTAWTPCGPRRLTACGTSC
jgi:hypothetical protein